MDDSERHQWARHFDNLIWTMSGILIASISGLLAVSYVNFNWIIAVAGLVLCMLPVYLAASFRELSGRASKTEKGNIMSDMTQGRRFYQWELYCLVFLAFEFLFILALLTNAKDRALAWVPVAVIVILGTIWLHWLSRSGN